MDRHILIVEGDRTAREFAQMVLAAAGYGVRCVESVEAFLRDESSNASGGVDRGPASTHRLSDLTPRERSVFDKIVSGRSNKRAARELGLSPRTIEFYRARIMVKMKAGSFSDLVRIALAA